MTHKNGHANGTRNGSQAGAASWRTIELMSERAPLDVKGLVGNILAAKVDAQRDVEVGKFLIKKPTPDEKRTAVELLLSSQKPLIATISIKLDSHHAAETVAFELAEAGLSSNPRFAQLKRLTPTQFRSEVETALCVLTDNSELLAHARNLPIDAKVVG